MAIPCQGVDSAFWLIQSYWIIWLMLSFIVSMVLGSVILHNWEKAK